MSPSHTPSARARHIFSYARMSRVPHTTIQVSWPRTSAETRRATSTVSNKGMATIRGMVGHCYVLAGGPPLASVLKTLDCEAYCDSLAPALGLPAGRGQQYEPTLVSGTYIGSLQSSGLPSCSSAMCLDRCRTHRRRLAPLLASTDGPQSVVGPAPLRRA